MARQKGSANFSGTLEVLAGGPIDARSVVPTLADLTVAANFPYPYVGMETYVVSENKKYRLIVADVTSSSNWEEVGSGGGGGGDSTKILTGTLAAASWSSKTQTVNVTGVTANTKGVVGLLQSATSAQVEAAKAAGITATAIGNGTITFACDEVPSVDIPFGVLIPGGQTPQVTANATVDGNTGTPDVQVTVGGTDEAPVFNFAFSNLKGATGAQGPKGDTGATGPQGPSGSGTPLNYSTSETRVGTWIDGKPLYQKTFTGTLIKTTTVGTIVNTEISVGTSVKEFIKCVGMAKISNGNWNMLNDSKASENKLLRLAIFDNSNQSKPNKIVINNSWFLENGTYYITAQYTKTTD